MAMPRWRSRKGEGRRKPVAEMWRALAHLLVLVLDERRGNEEVEVLPILILLLCQVVRDLRVEVEVLERTARRRVVAGGAAPAGLASTRAALALGRRDATHRLFALRRCDGDGCGGCIVVVVVAAVRVVAAAAAASAAAPTAVAAS